MPSATWAQRQQRKPSNTFANGDLISKQIIIITLVAINHAHDAAAGPQATAHSCFKISLDGYTRITDASRRIPSVRLEASDVSTRAVGAMGRRGLHHESKETQSNPPEMAKSAASQVTAPAARARAAQSAAMENTRGPPLSGGARGGRLSAKEGNGRLMSCRARRRARTGGPRRGARAGGWPAARARAWGRRGRGGGWLAGRGRVGAPGFFIF